MLFVFVGDPIRPGAHPNAFAPKQHRIRRNADFEGLVSARLLGQRPAKIEQAIKPLSSQEGHQTSLALEAFKSLKYA